MPQQGQAVVSSLLRFLYAVGVEGMAFLLPSATVAYFSQKREGYREGSRSSPALRHTFPKKGEYAGMLPDQPLPLPRKPSRKRRETGDKVEHVREWLKGRTVGTPGNLLPCKGEAYADYERWCRSKGKR